jgi:hypothetical protein
MALKVIYDNFADQTCVKVHYEVGFIIFFLKLKKRRSRLGFSKELKKPVLSEYLILLILTHTGLVGFVFGAFQNQRTARSMYLIHIYFWNNRTARIHRNPHEKNRRLFDFELTTNHAYPSETSSLVF